MSETTKIMSESTLRELMSLIAKELNTKADKGHSHSLTQLSDVNIEGLKDGSGLRWNDTTHLWEVGDIDISEYTEEDIIRLWRYAIGDTGEGNQLVSIEMLDKYAKLVHSHEISDISNLQEILDELRASTDTGQSGFIGDYVESVAGKTGIVELDINDISNLPNALSDKADISHTHIISDIDGAEYLESDYVDTLYGSLPSGTAIVLMDYVKSVAGKTGNVNLGMSDIAGLVTALEGKAIAGHVHEISEIKDLETQLKRIATQSHTHTISEIEGLTEVLNKLSSGNVSGELDTITGLTEALAGKADLEHTHKIAEIQNLQNILNLKAKLEHDHTIDDIEGATYLDVDSIDTIYGETSSEMLINGYVKNVAGKTGEVVLRVADIEDIDTVMENKADVIHVHSIADIQGLQEALDAKGEEKPDITLEDLLTSENTISEDDINALWDSY